MIPRVPGGVLLLLACGRAPHDGPADLACPAELGFVRPSAPARCAGPDPVGCCLGDAPGVSEEAATCLADALGFAPGPGGRFVELDEAKGRWTWVSIGRTDCGPGEEVGLAQGCGLTLDARTGEVVSEGSVVWSASCEDRS